MKGVFFTIEELDFIILQQIPNIMYHKPQNLCTVHIMDQ